MSGWLINEEYTEDPVLMSHAPTDGRPYITCVSSRHPDTNVAMGPCFYGKGVFITHLRWHQLVGDKLGDGLLVAVKESTLSE